MVDKGIIENAFVKMKKIFYIEKDCHGNIIYPSDKETLKLYREIIKSEVRDDDQFYHKDSKTWYEISTQHLIDEESMTMHTINYFEDITRIKEKERILKLDALTTLLKDRNESEKMINEYIEYAIKNKEEFALVIGDVDYFKTINDTYGHECGDYVLKSIGPLLFENTRQTEDKFDYRENDIVTRFGGDEFLILLKNISLDDTKKKVDLLTRDVSNLDLRYKNKPIPIEMSFGYYHVENNNLVRNNNVEKIRTKISKKADEYLYLNKNNKKVRRR